MVEEVGEFGVGDETSWLRTIVLHQIDHGESTESLAFVSSLNVHVEL